MSLRVLVTSGALRQMITVVRMSRLVVLAALMSPALAWGQLANVWHIPGATQEGIPSTMRDPATPGAGEPVTFYQGYWKGDGANQTRGFFVYRVNGGAWQSTLLPPGYVFHSDVEDGTEFHNQYWKASVAMPAQIGDTFEYYFIVDSSDRDRTFLYDGNLTTGNEVVAQAAPYALTVSFPRPTVTVNDLNADYSKSNFYLDEINDTVFPEVTVRVATNIGPVDQVEVFTNLNNRERANQDFDNDGIEDGIIPPDGNLITTADTEAYFQAYAMSPVGGGVYEVTLPVLKTGAYRITARYRVNPGDPWRWISDAGIRDHAVVVAPTIARDMRVYEIHVTNVNATGPTFAQRGTFEDLHDPEARVNLDWLRELGLNWIWFQPFHPQGLDGRETDPATGQDYDPGSPYSIRNFWQINPLYTRSWNGDLPGAITNPDNFSAAMQAFQNFAAASDEAGVQLMLDFPFNHTAPDVVLGAKGLELFGPAGHNWQEGDLIRDRVPGFFSTDGAAGAAAYSAPAQSAARIAVAPDRNDFGKWNDVRDVFFGRYATLVTGDPSAEASRAITRNEGDWVDYASMGAATINVWRYFGEVLPYWLVQSGHRGVNSTPSDGDAVTREALDLAGIDGLRKDFGQGLPPQAMEYIINRTHSVKWNFVFMTESLDGGEVTYRSSRHFAVLNENIVFPWSEAATTSQHRSIFEDRRNAYGQSLVLLNNTSHDEKPFADPWEAVIRYAVGSTIDGAPMIMYGQEIGAGQKAFDSTPEGSFDFYELNFGKFIPHFKKWNSMQPQWTAWENNDLGVQFLYPVYSGVGLARELSPALRSSNRWFLNPSGATDPDETVFAVAKYEEAGVPTGRQDVVLGFINLDRDNPRGNAFGIPAGLGGLLGLQAGRSYNVKNIAAYIGREGELEERLGWLWPDDRTGGDILTNGVTVFLNAVPSTEEAWATVPYEAQYLRVYDVTAPPPVAGTPEVAPFTVDGSVNVSWSAVEDPDGPEPLYLVKVYDSDGAEVEAFTTPGTEAAVEDLAFGGVYTFTVTAVNPHQPQSASTVSTTSAPVRSLDPQADDDGDGMSNRAEAIAGTDPFDPGSVLRADLARDADDVIVTWNNVPGRTYRVETRSDLVAEEWLTVPSGTGLTGDEFRVENPARTGFYRVVVEE